MDTREVDQKTVAGQKANGPASVTDETRSGPRKRIIFAVVAVVVITSYFRIRLGRRVWKAFHFGIYIAAAALFFHSLLTDPDLKNAPVDWFDGGKIFVEISLMLIAAFSLMRWRYARKRLARASPSFQRIKNEARSKG